MSPQQSDLPPPKNWQEFQDLCHALWELEWRCSAAQKNGRNGQQQHGVDIFGRPNDGDAFHGIQCKVRSMEGGSEGYLTRPEVRREVESAKKFVPPLKQLIIATTAPSDARIQKFARQLSVQHARQRLFMVDVLAWPEIVARLVKHESLLNRFYPAVSLGLSGIAGQIQETRQTSEEIKSLVEELLRRKVVAEEGREFLLAELLRLREQLHLNDEMIKSFLRDVGETPTNPQAYPEQLKQFAEKYHALLKQVEDTSTIPLDLEANWAEATNHLKAGALGEAEVAFEGMTSALAQRRAEHRAEGHRLALEEASTIAIRGALAEARFQYLASARLYHAAAECVPPDEGALKWMYLTKQAHVLRVAGESFGHGSAIRESIRILRTRALPLVQENGSDWATTQNEIGVVTLPPPFNPG